MTQAPGIQGYGQSDGFPINFPSGGNDANTPLYRSHTWLTLAIPDCSKFQAGTTLRAMVKYSDSDNWMDLYEQNDPATRWVRALPTSGTMACMLSYAGGARAIRLILSATVTGATVINVYGFDPALA